MMTKPWIALTALCVGTLAGLPRWLPGSAQARPEPDPVRAEVQAELQAQVQAEVQTPQGLHGHAQAMPLQDLSNDPYRRRAMAWTSQPPDEDGMASLQAQSSESLNGMTWILPGGIASLHLREGQAQLIEEPGQWRVVAGDVRRLALHWQQRPPTGPDFN